MANKGNFLFRFQTLHLLLCITYSLCLAFTLSLSLFLPSFVSLSIPSTLSISYQNLNYFSLSLVSLAVSLPPFSFYNHFLFLNLLSLYSSLFSCLCLSLSNFCFLFSLSSSFYVPFQAIKPWLKHAISAWTEYVHVSPMLYVPMFNLTAINGIKQNTKEEHSRYIFESSSSEPHFGKISAIYSKPNHSKPDHSWNNEYL